MTNFIQNYGSTILEYVWIPIIVPILALLGKYIVFDRLLYVKEIKKLDDASVEDFIDIYNERIADHLKICVDEILQYIGHSKKDSVDHHLYVCKKLNKTVGFIKFMVSKEYKYIFIAYVAIDNNDKTAVRHGLKTMCRKLTKKHFKPQIATCIITEVDKSTDGGYITALSRIVARYAKILGKESYYVDIPYIQPQMPDDEKHMKNDDFLSLLYIPYYSRENNRISKSELMQIIESIYFDIYGPSCNPDAGCDCDAYNMYLESLLELYRTDTEDYVRLFPLRKERT